MTLSPFPSTMTGWALAAALTIAAGTASAAMAAPADTPAMTTARSTASVTIEPAGYYRPYYGPRYRYPRYGYPHYYRGYYYPRVWWGAPAYVPPPRVVIPAGRCARWANACAANWGYGNRDYYGCLRYHGC